MKKLKLKIRKGLKAFILVTSLLGGGCALAGGTQMKVIGHYSYAFIGLVASFKKKKLYDDLDEETKSFLEATDGVLKSIAEDKADKSELETITTQLKALNSFSEEEKKSITDGIEAIKKQAAEIQKLKDAGLQFGGNSANPIVKALKEDEAKFKSFLTGAIKSYKLEVKAVQAPTDIQDHTIGMRVPGIGQIPVRKPFIEDIFPSVNCTLEFIKYVDQDTVIRDASNVAVAQEAASNSKITWIERNIQVTGVRDLIDVPIDMMSDYDFVEGEVNNLITSSVQLKADNGLLLGTGVNPDLHSIDEVSSEFNAANVTGGMEPWTATIQAPTIFDLVIAMASQIIALGQDGSFMPDTVLWNTIDKYKAMLIKDKNNNYILPPFVVRVNNSEYQIDGMRVRSNPLVPANSMYMLDSTKGTIYNRRGLTLEMSYENNNNFEHEVVTIKAYRRVNLLVRNVNKNAFMKCSNVTNALTAISNAV